MIILFKQKYNERNYVIITFLIQLFIFIMDLIIFCEYLFYLSIHLYRNKVWVDWYYLLWSFFFLIKTKPIWRVKKIRDGVSSHLHVITSGHRFNQRLYSSSHPWGNHEHDLAFLYQKLTKSKRSFQRHQIIFSFFFRFFSSHYFNCFLLEYIKLTKVMWCMMWWWNIQWCSYQDMTSHSTMNHH